MKKFVFEKYEFNTAAKTASFFYSCSGYSFKENYRFDFEFADFDNTALEQALEILFLLAGVSYYKAFLVPEIEIKNVSIDKEMAGFLEQTYQKGLGELFYVNNLDPNLKISFPTNSSPVKPKSVQAEGMLIGIGGGKDSLVGVETLKNDSKLATWSLGHRKQLEDLVERIGSKHFFIERSIDKQIIELNKQPGVYNGHIPISAIFAAVGTVTAILGGYNDVVVSNEHSANEANLSYKGQLINHQYSKTSEFELSYQHLLRHLFDNSIRYYSVLRPLREIAISRAFAENYFDKYKDVFSSCNRAFTQNSSHMLWCGECAKCATIYLLFSPFLKEEKLSELYGGKNLLLDENLEETYRQLLGISGSKPLDCVGEIAESRWAMSQMKKHYPSLEKFTYEEANEADIWKMEDHLIPVDVWEGLKLEQNFKPLVNLPKL